MSDRTLLIVNYRSAPLTARAIETARQSSSVPLRVVVVDNSCSPGELGRLRSLTIDELIGAPSNLGYGRAINLALPRCGEGELIISNPDVEFSEGAIDLLCAAMDDADIAGPALYWDRSLRWNLPPAENTTAWSKTREAAASRWPRVGEAIIRRRAARRVEFWTRHSSASIDYVSGAVMATRPAVLRRLGGFDERFELYFEETDLMTRLRRAGGTIRFVPQARCRHLFNQSSSSPSESGRLYARAEELYLRKWSPEWVLGMARKMATAERRREKPRWVAPAEPIRLPGAPEHHVVEASPLWSFWSAAGCFPTTSEAVIPDEILETYKGSELFVRVVDRRTLRLCPGLLFQISVK